MGKCGECDVTPRFLFIESDPLPPSTKKSPFRPPHPLLRKRRIGQDDDDGIITRGGEGGEGGGGGGGGVFNLGKLSARFQTRFFFLSPPGKGNAEEVFFFSDGYKPARAREIPGPDHFLQVFNLLFFLKKG